MIPCSNPILQTEEWRHKSWQFHLKNLITEPDELLQLLQLDKNNSQQVLNVCEHFPLRVPRPFVDRMKLNNPNDPLLLQVLPQAKELLDTVGFSSDPLEEAQSNPISGLIHKYHGRVLLLVSGHCPIHCRYCFRRHFPYNENNNSRLQWQKVLDYIRQDNSIKEVIYSGGDPLSANDKQLFWLTNEIAKIPHVMRLRVHTRLPIVIPQRITDECLQWLTSTRLTSTVVLHINHAQELNHTVATHLNLLRNTGITLLNQTVLLKHVNDSADTLVQLSETLFEYGILPYYLHLLDKVQGAAHFDIDINQARYLHNALRSRLPGYLTPKLVFEQANQTAKTPIEHK